ncbi:MAG: GGDEF domain-containing protein, partial [Burkholderiaceae bacterium]
PSTTGVVLGGVARCVVLVTFFRGMQYRLSVANDRLGAALAQIETLVRSDELTGVANRRGIMESLHRQRELADRSQLPFCVALLDIDHFKRINDHYGHAAGDRVLRVFGALLAGHTRAVDRIGRYGGEEFLVVMPDTATVQAADALERLRQQIVAANWTGMTGVPCDMTATIGVAQYRAGESVDATIRRADEALYRGKAAGRNRVVVETIR